MKTLRLDAWLDTMSKGSEAIVDNDQTRIKQKVNVKKVNIGGGESPTWLLRLELYEEGR